MFFYERNPGIRRSGLSRQGINANVNLSDNFGTNQASDPYIGLNFNATGGITYGYSLNYNLSLGEPINNAYAG